MQMLETEHIYPLPLMIIMEDYQDEKHYEHGYKNIRYNRHWRRD